MMVSFGGSSCRRTWLGVPEWENTVEVRAEIADISCRNQGNRTVQGTPAAIKKGATRNPVCSCCVPWEGHFARRSTKDVLTPRTSDYVEPKKGQSQSFVLRSFFDAVQPTPSASIILSCRVVISVIPVAKEVPFALTLILADLLEVFLSVVLHRNCGFGFFLELRFFLFGRSFNNGILAYGRLGRLGHRSG